MPKFSDASKQKLATCHVDLQKLANMAIEIIDFSILEGFRDEARQTQAFNTGRSKMPWPHSKHNQTPSLAFDFAPVPVDFKALKPYYRIIGVLEALARVLGIKVRFGADFKGFPDLGHIELVE